jgi:hypothetical protein
MAGSHEPRLCRLEEALGQAEQCPGAACPFWDRAVPFGGRCAVEELDLRGRPEIAEWLLGIRTQLETVGRLEDQDASRRELYRLLETGDADGG